MTETEKRHDEEAEAAHFAEIKSLRERVQRLTDALQRIKQMGDYHSSNEAAMALRRN